MSKQDFIFEKLRLLKKNYQIFIALWLANKCASRGVIQKGFYSEASLLSDLRRYFSKKFPTKATNKLISKEWNKFKKRLENNNNGFTIMQYLKYNEIANNEDLFDSLQIKILEEIVKEISTISKNKELLIQIYFFLRNYDSLLSRPHHKSENFTINFKKEFEKLYELNMDSNIDTLLIRTGLLFESMYVGSRNQYKEILYNVPDYYILIFRSILADRFFRNKAFEDFVKSKTKKVPYYCRNCGKELGNNMRICSDCGSEIELVHYNSLSLSTR